MLNISIIIPTFNEEEYISKCLDSIFKQDFEGLSYEVIVADGLSNDNTVEIVKKYEKKHNNLILCTNNERYQVYALNKMILMARGNIIIRCDAHAEYDNGYFVYLHNQLEQNDDIGNLGSHVKTIASEEGLIPKVVSLALHSKFGVGVSHRTMFSDKAKDVDTVLFGAWRNEAFKIAGLFDTNFIRGQDVEHNIRLKKAGKRIVQMPGPLVRYYARNSIKKMFNMMKQYASVKPMLYKKHRVLPNIRSLFPLMLFAGLGLSLATNSMYFLILLGFYITAALGFAWYETHIKNNYGFVEWLALTCCYVVQHIGHAFGMVIGVVNSLKSNSLVWGTTR